MASSQTGQNYKSPHSKQFDPIWANFANWYFFNLYSLYRWFELARELELVLTMLQVTYIFQENIFIFSKLKSNLNALLLNHGFCFNEIYLFSYVHVIVMVLCCVFFKRNKCIVVIGQSKSSNISSNILSKK